MPKTVNCFLFGVPDNELEDLSHSRTIAESTKSKMKRKGFNTSFQMNSHMDKFNHGAKIIRKANHGKRNA
jgi:hypothetical protein